MKKRAAVAQELCIIGPSRVNILVEPIIPSVQCDHNRQISPLFAKLKSLAIFCGFI